MPLQWLTVLWQPCKVGCVPHQQADGIEQVNDRCKLVRRHQVAPQRALDRKLQSFGLG
jgi:hypothetical protein